MSTATAPDINTVTHKGEQISYPSSNLWKFFLQSYGRHLVFCTGKLLMLELNGGCLKLNKIVNFGHLKNLVNFSNINDIFKSALQKWILSHPRVIQSPITNYYIKLKLYGKNRGTNTELHQ